MGQYTYEELDSIIDMRNRKANRTNVSSTFYSITRNIKEFTKQQDLNEIIEELKEKYPFDEKGQYYYNLLNYLNNKIYKENFDKENALYILINVIDSDCEMYKIYESECKVQNIQKKIRNKFGFYDDRLIKQEKIYVDFYKSTDEYNFSKKIEY